VDQFLNALLSGVGIGSIFALVALGFSFILKTTDSFNFAQGQLVPVGGLVTFTAYMAWGLPAGLALLVVVLIVAALGGVIERVAVFPLARRNDKVLLWLMSTLGISVILTGVSIRIWGAEPLGVDNYIGDRVTRFTSDVYVSTPFIIAFLGAIAVAIGIALFQRFTRWGRTMRAIADNRDAVELSGVNVTIYGLAAYAIGAALAGIGGFLIAPITYASATGGFTFTILGFAALAMGGFGSHWGALIGGWMVGVVQSLAGTYFGLQFQDFAVFLVLLTILMIRPDGLFSFGNVRKV
jgi:branched-chain amino acid transport system permease protein